MRVEPELPMHPKFMRLKRIVGDAALEYLVRLWAHCQGNQRGEHWPGADADYVEMICGWDGEPGVLFKGLTECGKPGFVEVEKSGRRIHDWEEMNSQTVANWRKNPNGRKGKNQPRTNREPSGSPVDELGLNGGSKDETREPSGSPVVAPVLTPTGTHSEPTALSVSPSISHSANGNGEPNGKPVVAPVVRDDFELARELVGVLNEVTGAKFEPPLHELDSIVAALIETGRDVAGIKKMVRRQGALWARDAKARHWLKPGTLFGANFHDYYGQRDLPVAALDRKGLEERIAKNPANRESAFYHREASAEDKKRLREDKAAIAAA